MRIATWNVNSIRTRVGRVVDWLERSETDVLLMQEIKCKPEQFPRDRFEAAGYELAVHGLNQWNGVAIASRLGLAEVETAFDDMPGFLKGVEGPDLPREARAIGALVDGVKVWSLYVPNGRGLDDPHYRYKLDWFAALTGHVRRHLAEHPDAPLLLGGDFNVAPLPDDVGDPNLVEGVTTHVSPAERAAFHELLGAGLSDLVRPLVPTGYTYWDYKQLKFPRNEGIRIDFLLGSAALAESVAHAEIHRDERKGDAPSDHVPVAADIDWEPDGDPDDRPMIF